MQLNIQATSIIARKTLKPTQCSHSKTQKAQPKDKYLQNQLQKTKTHIDIENCLGGQGVGGGSLGH
jgi:hypothetical protein